VAWPPGWGVVELKLGDPDDDGRHELLLGVWKKGLYVVESTSLEKGQTCGSHP
jgi:hypothetical protein